MIEMILVGIIVQIASKMLITILEQYLQEKWIIQLDNQSYDPAMINIIAAALLTLTISFMILDIFNI